MSALSVSSAKPQALLRYAEIIAAQGDQIAAEGRRLSAAVGRLIAGCREYPLGDVGGLADSTLALGGRNAELAGWVRGVAEGFLLADQSQPAPPPPPSQPPAGAPPALGATARWVFATMAGMARWRADQEVAEGLAAGAAVLSFADGVAWNWAALRLRSALQGVNAAAHISGGHLWGAGLGAWVVHPVLLSAVLDINNLIILEDGPLWAMVPVDSPDDLLKLLEQGFWRLAFAKVAPDLLLSLAEEIEELARQTCAERGACANPRTLLEVEPLIGIDGARLDVSPQAVFPGAIADPATGELRLPVGAIMAGPHSMISPFMGEQISMARIGEGEYLFAICGLDLENMPVAPNGLSAVIRTATGSDHLANAYYRLARQRFLRYLGQIPPGSAINVTGHSMGGGMTMLLLNDPEIQAALLAGGHDLRSVVTLGMVRPTDPQRDGIPPSQPSELSDRLFANTEVRHYVDVEDKLALSVGGGHIGADGKPLANVHLIDNGQLDSPVGAHTSYEDPTKYEDLPAELQGLPFQVDPGQWELYDRSGGARTLVGEAQLPALPNQPPPPAEEPPVVIAFP